MLCSAMIRSDRVFDFPFFDFHRCDKKIVIIDFNRLNGLINRQISSINEYYRLIDYIFDDRFQSIRYALLLYKLKHVPRHLSPSDLSAHTFPEGALR